MAQDKNKRTKRNSFDVWQRWEYKHSTSLLFAVLLFIILLDTSIMTTVLESFRHLGYIGVFVAGFLFVSVFTAVPAVALLISFSGLNIFIAAAVAGLGAMAGDYVILKVFEDKVAYELKPLAYKLGIPQAITYLQGRKSTLGIVRVIGAIIIASPLPDEFGIGLLGIGKLNKLSFLAICYTLNAIGIFTILASVEILT